MTAAQKRSPRHAAGAEDRSGLRAIAAVFAVALAIASAHINRPLPPGTFAVGELGLGGEVRSVPQLETRLREASRLGLGHAIVPPLGSNIPKLGGMALHEVRRLSQAMADL